MKQQREENADKVRPAMENHLTDLYGKEGEITHGMDDNSLNDMQVKLDMVGLCLGFVVFWTS